MTVPPATTAPTAAPRLSRERRLISVFAIDAGSSGFNESLILSPRVLTPNGQNKDRTNANLRLRTSLAAARRDTLGSDAEKVFSNEISFRVLMTFCQSSTHFRRRCCGLTYPAPGSST